MRCLVVVIMLLSLSRGVYAEDVTSDYWLQEAYADKQQDKLFRVDSVEKLGLDTYTAYSGVANLPFYPIIKLDFFKVFNKAYYKDKTFTWVIPNSSHEEASGIGIRLRMSAGWSTR